MDTKHDQRTSATLSGAIPWTTAAPIMGSNFFGIGWAMDYFRAEVLDIELDELTYVPFTAELLVACRYTHMLGAVLPLSIVDMRDQFETERLFAGWPWSNVQPFANKKGRLGWQLIRKAPITKSTIGSRREQDTLLALDEVVLDAQVMVYAIIGHFKATGERLFEGGGVGCRDCDVDGNPVCVRSGKNDISIDRCFGTPSLLGVGSASGQD